MSINTREDYPDLPAPNVQAQPDSFSTRLARLFMPRRMLGKDLDSMVEISLDKKLSGATPGGALIIVRNLIHSDDVRRQIFWSSTEHATSAQELIEVGLDFEPTHEATIIEFESHDHNAGYIFAPNFGATRIAEPGSTNELTLRPLEDDEIAMLVPDR